MSDANLLALLELGKANLETQAPREESSASILIVMPVFGADQDVYRSILSVLRSAPKARFELLIVDDASPSHELRKNLEKFASSRLITLIQNEKNLGFPGSCNKGASFRGRRDIVVLNSDTEVYSDWLDRLRSAAYTDERVASVTPLTNNGTICSYPRTLEDNKDSLFSGAQIDVAAAKVNSGVCVQAPTGVGFCMYIKNSVLAKHRLFDEEIFKRGYGEENDFCQRTIADGFTHLITADTFVTHFGGSSFGHEKYEREQAAMRILTRLHPEYSADVARFVERDELAVARRRLDQELLTHKFSGQVHLFLTHSWGGGTERAVLDIAIELQSEGALVLIGRPTVASGGFDIALEHVSSSYGANLGVLRPRTEPSKFLQTLNELAVSKVTVHHFVQFDYNFPELIGGLLEDARIPFELYAHDHFLVCPRIRMVDETERYCGEPSLETCQRCIDRNGAWDGTRPSVLAWQDRSRRLLKLSSACLAPSEDTASRLNKHLHVNEVKAKEHPFPSSRFAQVTKTHTWREKPQSTSFVIVSLGVLSTDKGRKVLRDVAKFALDNKLPFIFRHIGSTDLLSDFDHLSNVEFSGEYEETQVNSLISGSSADLFWFPVIWPETYSYTLSHVFEVGDKPIVAFDLGAIAERISSRMDGTLLPLNYMFQPKLVAEFFLKILNSVAETNSQTLGEDCDA